MTAAAHLLAAAALVVGSTVAAAVLAATAPAASSAPVVPVVPVATSSPATTTPTAPPATAFEVLARLPVRDRDPVGYTAAQRTTLFGPPWADVDHNGCDTRNDVLRRDLHDIALAPGPRCPAAVAAGTLHDPYTGHDIPFRRDTGSSAVQIDHVVSLADTWRSGANAWTPDQRKTFANNPANLLAVSGPVNESKGDDTAAQWTPPDPAYGCRYAGIVIAVKAAPLPALAPLSVSVPERDALAALLKACPGQPAKAAA